MPRKLGATIDVPVVDQPVVEPVTTFDAKDPQAFRETAEAFAKTFLDIQPGRRNTGNRLDALTNKRLNDIVRRKRSNPPPPATIINLHPWKLEFSTGIPLLRGVTVPPCQPGESYSWKHIRHARHDGFPKEDGTRDFEIIAPIQIAGEFVREFGSDDNYGGGVIIYTGERSPDKVDEVETYDLRGKPIEMQSMAVEYDEEENPVSVPVNVPVKRKLLELIEEQRELRNQRYMRRVQVADSYYKSNDPKLRRLIIDTDRLMAEVLKADGIIPRMPDWNMATAMEQGLAGTNCWCGATPQIDAPMCPNGHVISPLLAYQRALIEYGHVSMDGMSAEDWVEVEIIKAKRDEIREAVRAAREAKKN